MSQQSSSSLDVPSEHVCYVHCNFCSTILAVSVPGSSMLNVVTVRCGHCANLLSVNMTSVLQTLPSPPSINHQDQDNRILHQPQNRNLSHGDSSKEEYGMASYKRNKPSAENEEPPPRVLPIRPPEKRQRVPSAYNRFIKEEIQRIKASNPDITHREAFSSAAKNRLEDHLTRRQPVDMSQPQGQENLVTRARPFIASKEGVEMIIDPSLGSNVPFDSVGKVAAIASMCVQPEVTHRPFMGEVVQALKLVCNECIESKAGGSESCGQEDASVVIHPNYQILLWVLPDHSTSPEARSGLSLSPPTYLALQELEDKNQGLLGEVF